MFSVFCYVFDGEEDHDDDGVNLLQTKEKRYRDGLKRVCRVENVTQ
jgi:hypothetical protein